MVIEKFLIFQTSLDIGLNYGIRSSFEISDELKALQKGQKFIERFTIVFQLIKNLI